MINFHLSHSYARKISVFSVSNMTFHEYNFFFVYVKRSLERTTYKIRISHLVLQEDLNQFKLMRHTWIPSFVN
jgi:hypothetical protein